MTQNHDQHMLEKYTELFGTQEGFQDLMNAHMMSGCSKDDVKDKKDSKMSGCFHCCQIYATKEALDHVEDWAPENYLICPRCGIDAVIWDTSGFPATDLEFLKKMNKLWFSIQ
jgi:hypothetical protein